MGIKELTINGMLYQYRQQYLKEDNLWECAYVDIHDNLAEVTSGNLVSYDESLETAQNELDILVKDNELEPGVDNEVVIWKYFDSEMQRKIKVRARTLKMDLLGEWDTDESRYAKWCTYMHCYCGIWFSKSQYDII